MLRVDLDPCCWSVPPAGKGGQPSSWVPAVSEEVQGVWLLCCGAAVLRCCGAAVLRFQDSSGGRNRPSAPPHCPAPPRSNWGNWVAAAGLTGGRINKFNITKQSNVRARMGAAWGAPVACGHAATLAGK